MGQKIILESPRLYLSTADRRMAADILKFHQRNEAHLRPWEAEKGEDFYTLSYHRFLVKYEQRQLKNLAGVDFWLMEKQKGQIMGKVSVFGIIGGNFSSCMAGYKLDQDYVGQGYMTEALGRVEQFLFEDMNLHRIEVNILPRNARSIAVVKRLGYTLECESKQSIQVDGRWEDHLRYVKLNDHWKES